MTRQVQPRPDRDKFKQRTGDATEVAKEEAFTIWLNQWSDYLCYPDSWFQPHAAWHLLSALSTWFFFVFFRTEKSIGS